MKIKKGDKVIVIAGKDKGKTGTVLRALPKEERVVVEGVGVVKKHQKPTQQNSKGQIIEKSLPVHVSNVQIIDPKTKKPTRIAISKENGKRVRIAVGSGSKLD